MINLHEKMLPDMAGIEPATSWSPVGRAPDWATEANLCQNCLAPSEIVYMPAKVSIHQTILNALHVIISGQWNQTMRLYDILFHLSDF